MSFISWGPSCVCSPCLPWTGRQPWSPCSSPVVSTSTFSTESQVLLFCLMPHILRLMYPSSSFRGQLGQLCSSTSFCKRLKRGSGSECFVLWLGLVCRYIIWSHFQASIVSEKCLLRIIVMSHDVLFERRASLTLQTTWRTTGPSWLCLLGILLQGFIIILNAKFIAITCFQLLSLCLPFEDFLSLVTNTIMSPQVNMPPCPQATTSWFCQPHHQEALPSHLWPCHFGEVFFKLFRTETESRVM